MFRTALVVLAAMACVQARPQRNSASGQSSATQTQGETLSPLGLSNISQQQASTGGQTTGLGANFGNAFANTAGGTGLFSKFSSSQTGANSQQSGGGFRPLISVFPSHLVNGASSGLANAQQSQGVTNNVDGTTTTISQSSSQAGGSVQGFGTSKNSAKTSNIRVDTPLGSQTQSSVGAQSSQRGR